MIVIDGITYQVQTSTTARVVGYDGSQGSVVTIADEVTINGTVYAVHEVGNNAFRDSQLTGVVLPDSLTSIGNYAFAYNELTEVTLPNSLTSIGNYAFAENELTEVTLPNSLTSIGNYAFVRNQLTEVTLPNSLTSIGSGAFAHNQLTEVVLPDSLTSIGNYAFTQNQLTELTLPDSLTSIGNSAFYSNQLTHLTLPDSLTSIGNSAFYSNQLTELTLPDSLTSIGNSAFRDNQLTELTLPDPLTRIGPGAFRQNQLTHLTLPDSLTSIGNDAFHDNQLIHVVFPDSLESIEGYAFEGNQLAEVALPESLSSIGFGAFRDNGLTRVVLPESLTSVGGRAFEGNPVAEVVSFGPAPGAAGDAFGAASFTVYHEEGQPGYDQAPWDSWNTVALQRTWVPVEGVDELDDAMQRYQLFQGASPHPDLTADGEDLVAPKPVGWSGSEGALVYYSLIRDAVAVQVVGDGDWMDMVRLGRPGGTGGGPATYLTQVVDSTADADLAIAVAGSGPTTGPAASIPAGGGTIRWVREEGLGDGAHVNPIRFASAEGAQAAIGETFYIRMLATEGEYPGQYADGGSYSHDPDLTWRWDGPWHKSTSSLVAPTPQGWHNSAPEKVALYYSQSRDMLAWRTLATPAGWDAYAGPSVALPAGQTATFLVEFDNPGDPRPNAPIIDDAHFTASPPLPPGRSIDRKVEQLRPSPTPWRPVWVPPGQTRPGDTIYFRVLAAKGEYGGDWFDGDTHDTYQQRHVWLGQEHASRSTKTIDNSRVVVGGNLFSNPSFETGLGGVERGTATTVDLRQGTSATVAGDYGLRARVEGASASNGWVAQWVELPPAHGGGWASFSFQAAAPDVENVLVYAQVERANGTLSNISAGFHPLGGGPLISEPRRVEAVEVPPDAVRVRWWLRFKGETPNSAPRDGYVYTDAWMAWFAPTREAATAAVRTYADGDHIIDPDRRAEWWGAPHESPSFVTGPVPYGWQGEGVHYAEFRDAVFVPAGVAARLPGLPVESGTLVVHDVGWRQTLYYPVAGDEFVVPPSDRERFIRVAVVEGEYDGEWFDGDSDSIWLPDGTVRSVAWAGAPHMSPTVTRRWAVSTYWCVGRADDGSTSWVPMSSLTRFTTEEGGMS